MKVFVLFAMCLAATCQVNAQDDTPGPGGFSFSDVVQTDSMSRELLFRNTLRWLKGERDKTITIVERDSVNGRITAAACFLVYSQPGVLAKISGRIYYDLTVEMKDNKYRYAFANFVFHYYKQDRNYKWVDNGQVKRLDETKATGWQKLWNQHRATTTEKITASIQALKAKITEQQEKLKLKEKKKVEW